MASPPSESYGLVSNHTGETKGGERSAKNNSVWYFLTFNYMASWRTMFTQLQPNCTQGGGAVDHLGSCWLCRLILIIETGWKCSAGCAHKGKIRRDWSWSSGLGLPLLALLALISLLVLLALQPLLALLAAIPLLALLALIPLLVLLALQPLLTLLALIPLPALMALPTSELKNPKGLMLREGTRATAATAPAQGCT